MRESVKELVGVCSRVLALDEPTYEFGARQVPGQEGDYSAALDDPVETKPETMPSYAATSAVNGNHGLTGACEQHCRAEQLCNAASECRQRTR